MDASTNSARYPNGIGEPSARALFRAEATEKTPTGRTSQGRALVDDLQRKEAKLLRARFDGTMGGYTRFI